VTVLTVEPSDLAEATHEGWEPIARIAPERQIIVPVCAVGERTGEA